MGTAGRGGPGGAGRHHAGRPVAPPGRPHAALPAAAGARHAAAPLGRAQRPARRQLPPAAAGAPAAPPARPVRAPPAGTALRAPPSRPLSRAAAPSPSRRAAVPLPQDARGGLAPLPGITRARFSSRPGGCPRRSFCGAMRVLLEERLSSWLTAGKAEWGFEACYLGDLCRSPG